MSPNEKALRHIAADPTIRSVASARRLQFWWSVRFSGWAARAAPQAGAILRIL